MSNKVTNLVNMFESMQTPTSGRSNQTEKRIDHKVIQEKKRVKKSGGGEKEGMKSKDEIPPSTLKPVSVFVAGEPTEKEIPKKLEYAVGVASSDLRNAQLPSPPSKQEGGKTLGKFVEDRLNLLGAAEAHTLTFANNSSSKDKPKTNGERAPHTFNRSEANIGDTPAIGNTEEKTKVCDDGFRDRSTDVQQNTGCGEGSATVPAVIESDTSSGLVPMENAAWLGSDSEEDSSSGEDSIMDEEDYSVEDNDDEGVRSEEHPNLPSSPMSESVAKKLTCPSETVLFGAAAFDSPKKVMAYISEAAANIEICVEGVAKVYEAIKSKKGHSLKTKNVPVARLSQLCKELVPIHKQFGTSLSEASVKWDESSPMLGALMTTFAHCFRGHAQLMRHKKFLLAKINKRRTKDSKFDDKLNQIESEISSNLSDVDGLKRKKQINNVAIVEKVYQTLYGYMQCLVEYTLLVSHEEEKQKAAEALGNWRELMKHFDLSMKLPTEEETFELNECSKGKMDFQPGKNLVWKGTLKMGGIEGMKLKKRTLILNTESLWICKHRTRTFPTNKQQFNMKKSRQIPFRRLVVKSQEEENVHFCIVTDSLYAHESKFYFKNKTERKHWDWAVDHARDAYKKSEDRKQEVLSRDGTQVDQKKRDDNLPSTSSQS